MQKRMILDAGRWHLLPESYLYGLADVGIAAEFSHTYLLGTVYANHLEEALSEAQAAVALAPQSVQAEAELGGIWRGLQRPDESGSAFQKALDAAQTIRPEFQSGWIPGLKKVTLEGR